MRQFPNNDSNEDKNLVQFLKRYQSIAPIAPNNLEHRVMTLISKNDRSSLQIKQKIWVIPTAIMALLCLSWGVSRWLNPTPELLSTEAQSQELAAFLVDNWQNVGDNSAHLYPDATSSSEWQSLTYAEMTSYSPD